MTVDVSGSRYFGIFATTRTHARMHARKRTHTSRHARTHIKHICTTYPASISKVLLTQMKILSFISVLYYPSITNIMIPQTILSLSISESI